VKLTELDEISQPEISGADNEAAAAMASAARVPRTLEVEVRDTLVNTCVPGDLLCIVGVVKTVQVNLFSLRAYPKCTNNDLRCEYDLCLHCRWKHREEEGEAAAKVAVTKKAVSMCSTYSPIHFCVSRAVATEVVVVPVAVVISLVELPVRPHQ